MVERTGLGKAGEILLLVGSILQAVGGLFLAMFGIIFATAFRSLSESARPTSGTPPPPEMYTFMMWFYLGWGILSLVGAILGFIGYSHARQGRDGRAFVLGLIGSLLPPVNIIALLGAIFLKVSEGQRAPGYPPVPPGYPPYGMPRPGYPAYPPPGPGQQRR